MIPCLLWSATSPAAEPVETVPVDPALLALALPLPDALLDDLRAGRWETALAALRGLPDEVVVGDRKADRAFLVGWAAIHTEDPKRALDVLPALDGPHTAPDAWVDLVRAELLIAKGEPLPALDVLERVDPASVVGPRAAMDAHEALRGLAREEEAWKRLEVLVARPDPAEGNAVALLALAEHHGLASEAAKPYLLRLRTWYPASPEEQDLVASGVRVPLDWRARTIRAERLMHQGAYAAAVTETDGMPEEATRGDSADACRYRYVRGRSQTKRNEWSAAAGTLADVAERCARADGGYGAKGTYLLGTALSRVKRYADAAEAYADLARLYPTDSMADDGLTRGGIALREAGRADEARALWERAMADHPTGDTVPEAVFRLAFARYEAGDTADALKLAEELGALPLGGDALHVAAGRYWAARWRYYPDVRSPTTPSTDAGAREEAVRRWADLCRDLPQSFWSILAYSRLVEVAPDVARGLDARPPGHDDGSTPIAWDVRVDVLRDPHVRDAVNLFRVGLSREALAELDLAAEREWTPDERGWLAELRIAAGDWLFAHDELRKWLKEHPLGTLGPHEARLQRVAYPDRYWAEVRSSVQAGWTYEPRLFHGLVREESNFNREIVSFAGALGLSQLMPATAQQTAGWLGLKVTNADLVVPATNLRIGARYLEAMHDQLSSSPYLALAAYNGGAGNVNKWLAAQGNTPTDEFVVRIPFDETRGYVTRVMGTWQTYRYRFDDGPAFPDLSAFNHRAKP